MKDVAVIGAGASGLFFAILIKKENPDILVTVYEANDRVGKKLAITGNGRCNISNRNLDARYYHGDVDLADKTLQKFDFLRQKECFEQLGVYFKMEDDKAYPASFQAASVVDVLRFEAAENGVEIRLSCAVSAVERKDSGFLVKTANGTEAFKAVVVATGGKAGGKLGNTSGYEILKSLGHKIEPLFPAIVQLKTENAVVRQLKGIKVDAKATITSSEGIRTESGEVLFCDYGLSGPAILQVSRLANGQNAVVSLDVCPEYTEEELLKILHSSVLSHPKRPTAELFTGLINKKLGQVIMKQCGIDINSTLQSLDEKSLALVAHKIKNFKFNVIGTTGFENAQVTAGGAQTSQFFENFMSKKAKGLYAIGEVLNVDGDCGGFNLAFAWSSAYVTATSCAEYVLSDRI